MLWFKYVYPLIINLMSQAWGEELNVSFKRAVMNDIKNHQWRLAAVPMALIFSVLMSVGAVVFLIYGASAWFISDIKSAEVAMITGSALMALAFLSLWMLYDNLRFIIARIDFVQESMLKVRESTPLQKLYHQLQEEQNLFIDSLQKNKKQRSTYEPNNISVI